MGSSVTVPMHSPVTALLQREQSFVDQLLIAASLAKFGATRTLGERLLHRKQVPAQILDTATNSQLRAMLGDTSADEPRMAEFLLIAPQALKSNLARVQVTENIDRRRLNTENHNLVLRRAELEQCIKQVERDVDSKIQAEIDEIKQLKHKDRVEFALEMKRLVEMGCWANHERLGEEKYSVPARVIRLLKSASSGQECLDILLLHMFDSSIEELEARKRDFISEQVCRRMSGGTYREIDLCKFKAAINKQVQGERERCRAEIAKLNLALSQNASALTIMEDRSKSEGSILMKRTLDSPCYQAFHRAFNNTEIPPELVRDYLVAYKEGRRVISLMVRDSRTESIESWIERMETESKFQSPIANVCEELFRTTSPQICSSIPVLAQLRRSIFG